MKKYLENIDKQIEFNKGKNIFLSDEDSTLKFIDDTVGFIAKLSELSADSEKMLIDYTTDKSIEEFCRINQYYTFNRQAKDELRGIYRDLFANIKSSSNSIESISRNHYSNIREWLRRSNPFADKVYSNADQDIKPVACSEYSAELQVNVLKIDINALMSPVLDIGCGSQGNLVRYLLNSGIDAHGIDRFSFSDINLVNCDWLEFNYGMDKWGTIVSNLGFSNHFKHHNLREDGNFIEYGMKYMDILKSLKVGGTFHYAPDLPFIESYLDSSKYQIDKFEIGEFDFKTTIIRRLK
jgi:hypothetical protein